MEEERLRALKEEEDKSRQLIAQLEEEEKRVLLEQQKRAAEDEQLARELSEKLQQVSFHSHIIRRKDDILVSKLKKNICVYVSYDSKRALFNILTYRAGSGYK